MCFASRALNSEANYFCMGPLVWDMNLLFKIVHKNMVFTIKLKWRWGRLSLGFSLHSIKIEKIHTHTAHKHSTNEHKERNERSCYNNGKDMRESKRPKDKVKKRNIYTVTNMRYNQYTCSVVKLKIKLCLILFFFLHANELYSRLTLYYVCIVYGWFV